jgi:ADP-ribose pyrophosphatase YjhB (NUDIX family)
MGKPCFKVKIVGVIFDPKKRKVLIGKTSDEKNYSFLEGYLVPEEEIDKELKRLTKEKTGFIIHNLGTIYSENFLADKEEIKIYFLCEATEGKEKKGEKVEELLWVKPTEAEKKLGVKFPTRLKEFIVGLE